MEIEVDCSCGQKFAIGKQYVGHAVACPACGATVVVPVPVWAPVQLESLPELKAQPTFSTYTLPAARPPSIWSQYKLWVLGGIAIVVLVSLLVAIVGGLIWLMSMIEPPAPGQRTAEPAVDTKQESGANPARVQPGAVPRAPASQEDDREDFEGDSMPPPNEAPATGEG